MNLFRSTRQKLIITNHFVETTLEYIFNFKTFYLFIEMVENDVTRESAPSGEQLDERCTPIASVAYFV